MKKMKPKVDEIVPGKICHVIKYCLDDNSYLDIPECAEIIREEIQVHLLPVCRVLGFLITHKTIEFVILPHPEDVIRNVPRNSRKIHTRLQGNHMMNDYLKGDLSIHNVTDKSRLCTEGSVHDVIIKKIANLLQCFTLKYNKHKGRTCRLTQRKHSWHEVPQSKLNSILSMQGALATVQGNGIDSKENPCSANSDIQKQDSTIIDNAFLLRYQKQIRNELKANTQRYLIAIGPGVADKELMRRSSIDWLKVLDLKPG